ncbi:DUF2218 domain-containing protein [Candidatus Dactylopiibacterium carminicum]|uniref:DUF2218 domain-containing protein n=1 Tax=Candidatus Dactylopiibacterium carminicum TaxID=857335 RepID=UPI001CC305A0|nr:DUF2218 domain-containing protein [Candidatus Dactylopiibacterium carminicum]
MSQYPQHSSVTLPNADKVLYKLSKHFALKVPVEFDDSNSRVQFPAGNCEIQREGDLLRLQCSADSKEKLAQVIRIVDHHLALMARNPELRISWTDA